MSQSTSTGPALNIQSSAIALRNTLIGNGGLYGILIGNTGSNCTVDGNTIVNFVDGVNVLTGMTGLQVITNNCITDCTTYAINNVDAGAPVFNSYNRLRDPITINNGTNWTAATSYGNVTTDGAAYSDYVAQGSGDYRLISSSPATSTALPYASSMGALQRLQTSSGGGQTSSASAY
jgi:hypothetical protein